MPNYKSMISLFSMKSLISGKNLFIFFNDFLSAPKFTHPIADSDHFINFTMDP